MAGHNNYQPGLLQIRPQYTREGASNPENILFWSGTFGTPLTVAQLTAIAAVFDPAWANMWKQAGAASTNYSGSILTDWSSNTGLEYTSVGVFGAVAGTAGTAAPANAAALISWSVPIRFRGGHGRSYLPDIGDTALASATALVSATVTTMNADLQTLITNMHGISSGNGGPFVPVIYKHRNANYPTNPLPVPTVVAVSSEVVNTNLASQRRRLRRAAHR